MRVKNGDILTFETALYNAQCSVCGDLLNWEADFDADGTTYYAKCCKKSFCMSSHTIEITIENVN